MGRGAGTVPGNMPRLTTEHAKVVLEMMAVLFICELSVLAKLQGQVRHSGRLLLELTRTFRRLPRGVWSGGRIGGGRRRQLGALVDGVRGLTGQGRSGHNRFWMMGLFGLVLPIACIDLLRQHPHVMEGVWFPYMSDLVLEPLRQPIIEVVLEGTFTIAMYLAHIAVELYNVLGDLVVVRHGQIV